MLEATDEKRTHHATCLTLLETHGRLRTSAQVIREYLVVATRPVAGNGLGLLLSDALGNVREFRKTLRLLAEEKPVLPTLIRLLGEVPCQGKRIHDAHLVATAIVHRVGAIVTLNGSDFRSYFGHVAALAPEAVARRPPKGRTA